MKSVKRSSDSQHLLNQFCRNIFKPVSKALMNRYCHSKDLITFGHSNFSVIN